MSGAENDDVRQLVHNDELAGDVQPHLRRHIAADDNVVSPEYVNPALEEDRTGKSNEGAKTNDNESIPSDCNKSAQNGDARNAGAISSLPVYYSARTGETNVVHEPVVIRQPNGVHVIRTRECCHTPNNYRRERPLKLSHIKLLKVFSIVAIVIFFPLGIPAMYFAFKSEKEFHAGILRGDIDLARKFAKRSERLMIFSVMGALLIAVAVFAIVERNLMANDEDYWKTRSNTVLVH